LKLNKLAMTSIALVTCQEFPDLYEDDQLFRHELLKLGFEVHAVCWDAQVNWSDFNHIIVRSTWDYFHHFPEFLLWLDIIETSGSKIWNTVPVMRWNSNKKYLLNLENKGIPIVPTVWIDAADNKPQLARVFAATGWEEAILKPAVSGGAFNTVRVNANNADEQQNSLQKILTTGTAMLQPFLREIQALGEYSFLFFNGQYQYTVLKIPKPGDFRVQSEHGSTTIKVDVPDNLISQAQKVMDVLDFVPLYARVDMVNVQGQLKLMELELIEPLLYLAYDDGAAVRFANIFYHLTESE
jgi:hypothetical protein